MNAGDLRKRITIRTPGSTTQNECGEDVPGYNDFATVWAGVEPLKGREYFEAQKIKADMSYWIKIRYLSGVTREMQVLYNGKVLDIQNVIDVDEKHCEMHLMCLERVQNV